MHSWNIIIVIITDIAGRLRWNRLAITLISQIAWNILPCDNTLRGNWEILHFYNSTFYIKVAAYLDHANSRAITIQIKIQVAG